MNMPINYILPGLYENFLINKEFLDVFKKYKKYFYDNANIRAVYGNFQYSTWDGGRVFTKYKHANLEEIEEIFSFYKKENIPIRFIFTNTKIKKENCFDRFNNLVLSICEDENNEIVVNSPILEEYIRTNYPKYSFVSSTTKCITDVNKLKEEINNPKYSMVCFDYNLNHNKNFLEKLSPSEKEKCEFLINAICPPGCPERKQHYDLNSYSSLNYGKKFKMRACGIDGNGLGPEDKCQTTHINPDEMFSYYLPNGFNNFKIEGRTFTAYFHLCNLVKYMVKPEYQIYIMSLFTSFFKKEGEN